LNKVVKAVRVRGERAIANVPLKMRWHHGTAGRRGEGGEKTLHTLNKRCGTGVERREIAPRKGSKRMRIGIRWWAGS